MDENTWRCALCKAHFPTEEAVLAHLAESHPELRTAPRTPETRLAHIEELLHEDGHLGMGYSLELIAEVRRLRGRDGSGLVWWRDDVLKEKLREARRGERQRCLALVRGLAPDCDAIAAAIGDYPD